MHCMYNVVVVTVIVEINFNSIQNVGNNEDLANRANTTTNRVSDEYCSNRINRPKTFGRKKNIALMVNDGKYW